MQSTSEMVLATEEPRPAPEPAAADGAAPAPEPERPVNIQVLLTDDRRVALAFDQPVQNLFLAPKLARQLAESLRQTSHQAEKAPRLIQPRG